jgi:hypothetical protein
MPGATHLHLSIPARELIGSQRAFRDEAQKSIFVIKENLLYGITQSYVNTESAMLPYYRRMQSC